MIFTFKLENTSLLFFYFNWRTITVHVSIFDCVTISVHLIVFFFGIRSRQLLGNSGVRAKLQNARMAPLLPPVGVEVFRRFTAASLEDINRRHEAMEKERRKRKENNTFVHNILIIFELLIINGQYTETQNSYSKCWNQG